MKKKSLNGQQLALLYLAFTKNLFPKPELGELLVGENLGDGSLNLYFNFDYHNKLVEAINAKFQAGAFAASNSENDWNELMYAIESAAIENNVDQGKYVPYGY
jgi:hypothetical protein